MEYIKLPSVFRANSVLLFWLKKDIDVLVVDIKKWRRFLLKLHDIELLLNYINILEIF
ncbi:MAG: hypothetical protein ACPKM0_03620 [Pleomorphochaeta sp.]